MRPWVEGGRKSCSLKVLIWTTTKDGGRRTCRLDGIVTQTLISYNKSRNAIRVTYYTILSRLSVWNCWRKKMSCQASPPWRYCNINTSERKREKQTYFCAETDGRCVFCFVLENSFYCWHWSRTCCVGSPSGLQVILWRKERPFYGEIGLLNNGKNRNSFF